MQCFGSRVLKIILIPGSVKKQLGSGSGFRGLLDQDSMNMDPKHWNYHLFVSDHFYLKILKSFKKILNYLNFDHTVQGGGGGQTI